MENIIEELIGVDEGRGWQMIIQTLMKMRRESAIDNRSAVRDLLTDIIHFCELHEIDFDKSWQAAKDAAAEEIMVNWP